MKPDRCGSLPLSERCTDVSALAKCASKKKENAKTCAAAYQTITLLQAQGQRHMLVPIYAPVDDSIG
jgi:hypothetical protein